MATAADPVLTRFRAALDKIYGERIERVVLFGSRARGDARPDSDYDVLVFLKDFDLAGRHEEMGRISKITADIVQDTGEMISALPCRLLRRANASDARGAARRRRPVKEESVLYLEKARWHLANACTIAAANIPEVAAREAYYAAFHAAECYIFEQTGNVAKTHKGVHSEFSRLAKDDPQVSKDLLPFSVRPTITSLFPTTKLGLSPRFMLATLSIQFKRPPSSSTASRRGYKPAKCKARVRPITDQAIKTLCLSGTAASASVCRPTLAESRHATGPVMKEELERENGRLCYSFDLRKGKHWREAGVDAMTGKLVENKAERANPED